MSRVGRSPIPLPKGVTVTIDGPAVTVKGPLGSITKTFHRAVTVGLEGDVLSVTRDSDDRSARSLHGLSRALLNNMVLGVTAGHRRTLLVTGIGFRCEQVGSYVMISCGLSHQVMVRPGNGVDVKVETNNRLTVSGIDKELVGDVAANIRAVRPIKPYIFRGDFQGIRYEDERPRRKAGKQGV